mgnify:CR=1 FL=1
MHQLSSTPGRRESGGNIVTGYFLRLAESNSIRMCQGSERTLPEGAGTQRDEAGKESWN